MLTQPPATLPSPLRGDQMSLTLQKLRVLVFVACLLPADVLVGIFLLAAQIVSLPLSLYKRLPARLPLLSVSSVTIQILNWDGKHLLEEFLPSVLIGAKGNDVLVVDNGSTDGSVEFLKSRFPQVRVLELDRNYGFSVGNNRGMEHIHTDLVVLLNNDMSVDPDFLDPLLVPFADPAVFAVASQITVPDPAKSKQETGKTRARFENGLFYLWHDPVTPQDELRAALPVFWAGGGASAIDRRKFEALGGFDSLYHPFYVEDTDLSYQAWKRGWRSLFAPASRVMHRHRATSGARFGELFVNNTTRRNHYLFAWKNLTDFGMLIEHLAMLPVIHRRAITQYGAAFEVRAYLRACLRLPLAIRRRLANVGAYVLDDRDVLGLTQ
jgi:GT2 family glycosyltransferase